MKDITRTYSNDDITIIWKPSICTHFTLCWKGKTSLLNVFNLSKKPWITPKGGTTEEIIERVERCPSVALSYIRREDI